MPHRYTRFPYLPRRRGSCQLVRTCCGLVSDTANRSATSWQQVVVMKVGKRYDKTDTTDFARANLLRTCLYVADLLRTCYVETGVGLMDFSLYSLHRRFEHCL